MAVGGIHDGGGLYCISTEVLQAIKEMHLLITIVPKGTDLLPEGVAGTGIQFRNN